MNQRIDSSKIFIVGGIYFIIFLSTLVGLGIELFQKGKIDSMLLVIPGSFLCITLLFGWLGINIEDHTKEEVGITWFRVFRVALYISLGTLIIPTASIIVMIILIAIGSLEPRLPIYYTLIENTIYIGAGLTSISIILLCVLYRHQKQGAIDVNRSLREADKFISMIKSLKTIFIAIKGDDRNQALGLIDLSLFAWSTKIYAENMLYCTNTPELDPRNPFIHIEEIPIEEFMNRAEEIGCQNIILNFVNPLHPSYKLTVEEFRSFIS